MSASDCAVCGLTMLEPGRTDYPAMEVGIHETCCAPDNLASAWAEAEAALPEGWRVESLTWRYRAGWDVEVWSGPGHIARWEMSGDGPTPAAALRALAVQLRERASG